MVFERDYFTRTLSLAVPLRNPKGIFVLQNLITLRVNDSRVTYQEILQPIKDRYLVSFYDREIEE